jgi:hypothetical protein
VSYLNRRDRGRPMRNRIVRMSSWRDRVTVSGEWRGCDYEMQRAVGFLEDMVSIMFSILPED